MTSASKCVCVGVVVVVVGGFDEQIQSLGPYVRQDVADKLNRSCEFFREVLGFQLDRIKDVQGNMIHGMQNLANAVYARLIQNDQRNDTRRNNGGLYAALRNLTVKIEKNPMTTKNA